LNKRSGKPESIRLADALIMSDQRKTLAVLYRAYVDELDPKTAADFFRKSPWEAEVHGRYRRVCMLTKYAALSQLLGFDDAIIVNIDESLGKKHKDICQLEAVDFHHNHLERTRWRISRRV